MTNIDRFGLWLLMDDREHFLAFTDYPWFKDATVEAIVNVEHLPGGHLRWPALDIDLSIESIEHPEEFPLIYSTRRAAPRRRRLARRT